MQHNICLSPPKTVILTVKGVVRKFSLQVFRDYSVHIACWHHNISFGQAPLCTVLSLLVQKGFCAKTDFCDTLCRSISVSTAIMNYTREGSSLEKSILPGDLSALSSIRNPVGFYPLLPLLRIETLTFASFGIAYKIYYCFLVIKTAFLVLRKAISHSLSIRYDVYCFGNSERNWNYTTILDLLLVMVFPFTSKVCQQHKITICHVAIKCTRYNWNNSNRRCVMSPSVPIQRSKNMFVNMRIFSRNSARETIFGLKWNSVQKVKETKAAMLCCYCLFCCFGCSNLL